MTSKKTPQTANETAAPAPRRGLISRAGGGVGRYFIKRTATAPAVGGAFRAMRANFSTITKVERLDPERISETYRGTEADGGRAKFAQMAEAQGLDEDRLDESAGAHRVTAIIFLLCGILFFGVSVFHVVTGAMFWGVVYFPLSLLFAALWFRNAFRAWQIRNRRFGSLSEFIKA